MSTRISAPFDRRLPGPRPARADGTRLLGFALAFEILARAVSDSGIHWVATVDVDPLGACGQLALVFNVPQGASRCRVATHWRRRPPTRWSGVRVEQSTSELPLPRG